MYRNVRCCVKSGGIYSEYFDCTNGLKQGCKTSPVLFSLVVNEVAKEINRKCKHGVQLLPNMREITNLLFADDIVLLSDSVPGLQNQLNNLKMSAEKFGLIINNEKTNVIVFRRGGHLAAHEKWSLGGVKLNVVNEYRYLGNVFSTKLCTNNSLVHLASRARAAVAQVQRSLRKISHVTPNVFFKLFDAQIQPIVLYASEVWGLSDCDVIEKVHISGLKQFLNVSARTPNVMVYGDSGRFPLYINARLRSVKYWLKILRMDDNRLPHSVYKMMISNIDRYTNWASNMRTFLIENGFGDVWNNQRVDNETAFIKLLRGRLIDSFKLNWWRKMEDSNRYSLYRYIKYSWETENYLYAIDKKVFRDVYIRFRMGITDLYNHRCRYQLEPTNSLCPLCRENNEDEVHFLLQCPALYDLREKYLLKHIDSNIDDVLRFLLSSKDVSIIRSTSLYMCKAFQRRTSAIESVEQDNFYLDN